jgi:hypothetical protein
MMNSWVACHAFMNYCTPYCEKNVEQPRQNLGIMFISCTYYFCRAIWNVKAVILMLVALVVAGAGAVIPVEKMC